MQEAVAEDLLDGARVVVADRGEDALADELDERADGRRGVDPGERPLGVRRRPAGHDPVEDDRGPGQVLLLGGGAQRHEDLPDGALAEHDDQAGEAVRDRDDVDPADVRGPGLAGVTIAAVRLAAATILAAANRTAAIVTPAKPRTAHVRRIDIVSISDRLASLIIVFREGAVRQVLVTLSATTEQEDLTRAAVVLDGIMAGRTAADAERALARIDATAPIGALVELVGQRVLAAVRDYDPSPIEEVFSDGLLHVMDAPEFDRSDKLRRVFAALENRSYLGGLFDSIAGTGQVQVFIGAENGPDEMRDVALVLASYGEPSRAVGVVGVLGPTRMAYRQAIGTVRFVSGLMNELVANIQA